ncbi:hypothetical protein WUBG_03693, partial [Wuchereria bancrofti]
MYNSWIFEIWILNVSNPKCRQLPDDLILKCDSLTTLFFHHLWFFFLDINLKLKFLKKCRLSIIKREVRQSLANESERIDDGLIDRCVEVGVGAVGTSSPVQLIGVAYNLYKQQLESSDLEKERAGRKHFALKFLDERVAEADRIFCYIMYKLPDGT